MDQLSGVKLSVEYIAHREDATIQNQGMGLGMKRRRFLQLSSGALGCSLMPSALRSEVSNQITSPGPITKTAPTVGETPQSLDELWQMASKKYSPARSALLKNIDQRGPFRSDWESLATYQVPEWYKDAKFGIFVHWGVYSVPAFGSEWYPRDMYRVGTEEYKHHLATYGPVTKFGYKDFIPMFKAEHYDPQAWASLFKDSGAKYVVPVFDTTMASQCTIPVSPIGLRSRWDHGATWLGNWRKPCEHRI